MRRSLTLKIEVTERCNARCVFCARDKAHPGDMTWSMATGIIDAFPEAVEVQPQLFGEPLLWPHIVELVEYTDARTVFYTNGSLLSGELAECMAAANPTTVIFSIDTHEPDVYEALRPPLKFAEVLANVERFQEIRRDTKTMVRACATEETRPHMAETRRFWESRVDSFAAVEEKPVGRDLVGSYTKTKCTRPSYQVVVKHDGTIVLCCLDWHAECVMGHVDDGIREVWEGAAFAAARETEPPMCGACSFRWRRA